MVENKYSHSNNHLRKQNKNVGMIVRMRIIIFVPTIIFYLRAHNKKLQLLKWLLEWE